MPDAETAVSAKPVGALQHCSEFPAESFALRSTDWSQTMVQWIVLEIARCRWPFLKPEGLCKDQVCSVLSHLLPSVRNSDQSARKMADLDSHLDSLQLQL